MGTCKNQRRPPTVQAPHQERESDGKQEIVGRFGRRPFRQHFETGGTEISPIKKQ